MPHAVRTLLEGKAVTEDGRFSITQIFFQPETWQIHHALLDLGGWFRTDEVLVSAKRFAAPREDGWPLHMSRAELDDAPGLDDGDPVATDLPPLVVGPFGNTFSPLMMAVAARDPAPDGVPEDLMRDGSGRVFAMERVTDWLGLEAFDGNGALGTIEDFAMSDTLQMTHAILAGGDRISLGRFRRRAEQGHALFD